MYIFVHVEVNNHDHRHHSLCAAPALARLASLPEGTSILGRDLARQANIPANYLSKMLLVLRNAGVVEAARGQGGGYRLGKPPREILLVNVVRLFGKVDRDPVCLLGERDLCSDRSPCSAHASWRKVRSVYLEFLNSTSVSDIAPRPKRRTCRTGPNSP